MEGLKKKYHDLSLRKAFILTVLITFCLVVALSGLCIWGCIAFRQYLLPDSNQVFLTIDVTFTDGRRSTLGARVRLGEEMSPVPFFRADEEDPAIEHDLSSIESTITKMENTYDMLTPKRKIAYQGCGVLMVALPAVFSMVGILLCGFFFFWQKLNRPLKLLSEATEQITDKNLDFKLSYDSKDEMGNLCRSFDQMRQALDENNRELWKMIEQQKMVQASIAHDLRNPIDCTSVFLTDDFPPNSTLLFVWNSNLYIMSKEADHDGSLIGLFDGDAATDVLDSNSHSIESNPTTIYQAKLDGTDRDTYSHFAHC